MSPIDRYLSQDTDLIWYHEKLITKEIATLISTTLRLYFMTKLYRGTTHLHFEYDPPKRGGICFVFVNALTGSTAAWQAEIGPALRAQGFGTLAYDFRGQDQSPPAAKDILDENLIVDDLIALIDYIAPPRLILAGHSIGGLFAAKAILKGASADGLVLINTLRKPGLALDWANEAIIRAAALGGSQLVMDMFLPMLVGPAKLADLHADCLGGAAYEPANPESGLMRLLVNSRSVNWEIPYERLTLPVLVMTGLRDRVFYNADDVAELLARLPNSQELKFPEYAHLIPAEDGAAVINTLSSFAARL